jgi:hypothetical protein
LWNFDRKVITHLYGYAIVKKLTAADLAKTVHAYLGRNYGRGQPSMFRKAAQ